MSTKITTRRRGPLVVEGPFELTDASGKKIDIAGRKEVRLCRCGASRTSPLCDGSHNRIAFQPHNEQEQE